MRAEARSSRQEQRNTSILEGEEDARLARTEGTPLNKDALTVVMAELRRISGELSQVRGINSALMEQNATLRQQLSSRQGGRASSTYSRILQRSTMGSTRSPSEDGSEGGPRLGGEVNHSARSTWKLPNRKFDGKDSVYPL